MTVSYYINAFSYHLRFFRYCNLRSQKKKFFQK